MNSSALSRMCCWHQGIYWYLAFSNFNHVTRAHISSQKKTGNGQDSLAVGERGFTQLYANAHSSQRKVKISCMTNQIPGKMSGKLQSTKPIASFRLVLKGMKIDPIQRLVDQERTLWVRVPNKHKLVTKYIPETQLATTLSVERFELG